jgi:hypothetical protein
MVGEPPKDVREMRKLIHDAAHGERIDGTPSHHHRLSMIASLARSVLTTGERDGMSGDDTMTMLAYYALKALEQSYDRELERLSLSPVSPILVCWPPKT